MTREAGCSASVGKDALDVRPQFRFHFGLAPQYALLTFCQNDQWQVQAANLHSKYHSVKVELTSAAAGFHSNYFSPGVRPQHLPKLLHSAKLRPALSAAPAPNTLFSLLGENSSPRPYKY